MVRSTRQCKANNQRSRSCDCIDRLDLVVIGSAGPKGWAGGATVEDQSR